MATNKHATIRYQALDKCFRNPGRMYYMDDLVDSCNQALYEFSGDDAGVKRRQIFEDVKFMESPQGWSIPLLKIRDGRKVYYRYEDLSFSINNQPLNEREEIQLREALLTLSRFKGMPQFEWVDELCGKLEQGLGLSKGQDIIMEFEQNQYLQGLEHITPTYEAIQNKTNLSIIYHPFSKQQPTTLSLSPYYLKQYNNRWFLFGATKDFTGLSNLALDRIVEIKPDNNPYMVNENIDFQEYFDDVIGVSVDNTKQPEKILLRIDSSLFPYIKTKPIHGSQKYLKNEGEGEFITLDLIPNYEFESIILGYGERIEVIEPTQLRNKIKNRLKEIIKKYE